MTEGDVVTVESAFHRCGDRSPFCGREGEWTTIVEAQTASFRRHASLAQLVEHRSCKAKVIGSSPMGGSTRPGQTVNCLARFFVR